MPLHPMVVHFPIALLVTSVLLDLIGLVTRRDDLKKAGFYTLIAGVLGGIAGAVTGFGAEEAAEELPGVEAMVEKHESLVIAALVIFGVMLAYRLLIGGRLAGKLVTAYVAAALIGVGSLAAGAHEGGEMVYEKGAGVEMKTHATTGMKTTTGTYTANELQWVKPHVDTHRH